MKIGRNSSTQKISDPYGIRNIAPVERVNRPLGIDEITGAYVTLTGLTENKKVNAITYTVPSATEQPEKVYNYKSGSGVSSTDVANMQPGDKVVYKTQTGDIKEYTYKTGDTAHNIMHAIGVSNNPYNNAAIKNNIAKYTNTVNALKPQNDNRVNTYTDDYVQVSLSLNSGTALI